MKTIKYIVAMLAGVAALSCVKEAGKDLPAPEADGLITIKAGLPEDVLTKAGAHVGFSWYWGEGDKIAVTGAEDTQIYKIKEGFTPKYAEFVGRPVKGDSFTISFPDNAATADWTGQTQAGNDSYAHLKYAAQLSDVDEYLSFAFKPEWAAEHNGTIKQTGVMKMVIALPDTVTAVNNVSIAAEEAIFFKGNGDDKVKKLELAVTGGVPAPDHSFTAWLTTSWNDVTVPAGTTLTVSVKTKGETIEKDITFTEEAVLMGGKVNNFVIDATGWSILTNRYASGKGTAEKPWVIVTPEQMLYMAEDLVAGECRYFKLGADIDMTGIEWKPLNAAGPYDKQIDFDGDNHTIANFSCSAASYPSFFGVLYGKCYDVKFQNATIQAASKGCGILGGYGGTGGKPCEVNNVHVEGTITSTAGNCVGGMFGTGREATISNSSANVVINCVGQQNGGIIGVDAGTGVTISNCWTSGSITSTASVVGGICGELLVVNSSVTNCFSTMTLKTQFYFGGIVGKANGSGIKGQKANNANSTIRATIADCIAWNNELTTNCTDANEHYSNGAIIGSTGQKNTLKNCWRKAALVFNDCAGNAAAGGYAPVDQDDANPDNPLVWGTGTYSCGYHGKAAGATETLSQVAQRIGWSTDIWDFSGDTPKLK